MIAVLVEPGSIAEGRVITLSDDEAHHLSVRRTPSGETVYVMDGAGLVATGFLEWRGKRAEVTTHSVTAVAKRVRLTLAVGAGDKDRFGWLVEKCAELAVTDVVPLLTEHVNSVATRVRDSHIPKLQARALEAIKQSKDAWAPVVHPPVSIATMVDSAEGICWLADMVGKAPPDRLSREPVTVAIGPEGGFAPEERDQFIMAGFRFVRLSGRFLRFETAGIAAAAVIAAARLRGARD
jgi:16S rRNA (uracil1498-N3)-methyltransferase